VRNGAIVRTFIATAASIIAVGLSTGAGFTAASSAADQPAAGGRATNASFVDHGGPVLRAEQLYLIYWGRAWSQGGGAAPTAGQITHAAEDLMASAYLTGLRQYRGIGRGHVRGSRVVASSEPPARFSDEQVAELIRDQISAGTIPDADADNQTLYGVVMPPGVSLDKGDWAGEHNAYGHSGRRIRYAWFANGTLDQITGIMSHEIVEAATDPEGSGFLGVDGTCAGRGWCEIADICDSAAVLDGVTVRSYWSNQAGECIVPVVLEPIRQQDSRQSHPTVNAVR
jgi:hypothetical protein